MLWQFNFTGQPDSDRKLEVESLYSQNTVFFFRSGAESKIESKKYARYVFSV